jgi:hypothetical protein
MTEKRPLLVGYLPEVQKIKGVGGVGGVGGVVTH